MTVTTVTYTGGPERIIGCYSLSLQVAPRLCVCDLHCTKNSIVSSSPSTSLHSCQSLSTTGLMYLGPRTSPRLPAAPLQSLLRLFSFCPSTEVRPPPCAHTHVCGSTGRHRQPRTSCLRQSPCGRTLGPLHRVGQTARSLSCEIFFIYAILSETDIVCFSMMFFLF